MSLWILDTHKPLIAKFYKSKYLSVLLTLVSPWESLMYSICKQMLWLPSLVIKIFNTW